jgi:two-component system, NarL family, response regulator DesR
MPRPQTSDLTKVEHKALEMAASGVEMKEIARKFGYHRVTVRRLLKTAAGKLGADNTMHAIFLATRRGILQ